MTEKRARDIVRDGYNRMAESYLASKDRDDPILLSYLNRLATLLPAEARVLDLGCGAGVPATQWLAERYRVVGVDLSERQLALARQHVPSADLVLADLAEIDFPPRSFDAVVSLYAIIHVSCADQPALVRRVARWLKPGGLFLATWALTAWEGSESNWEGWGAPMWWSHFGQDENLRLLRDAGLSVLSAERQKSHQETWLWVIAQAPEA